MQTRGFTRLPTLPTPRLLLRHVARADAGALLALFGDLEVTRYWGFPPLPDAGAADALVREIHELAAAGTLLQWGVARADAPDRLIGTCTLADIEPRHRRAALGFAVLRSEWGQGVATEFVARALRFGFEELGLERVVADADPRNHASLRLLERLGFQREGHLRRHYWQSDEWQDAVLLGLLRGEWKG